MVFWVTDAVVSFWILCWIRRYGYIGLLCQYGLETLIQQTGSALAIKTWAWQLTEGKGKPLPSEVPYPNEASLIESVKKVLEAGKQKAGRSPKVLVIGAVSSSLKTPSQVPN